MAAARPGMLGRPLARRRIQQLIRALRAGEITMEQFRDGLAQAMQAGLFSPAAANVLFPALPGMLPLPPAPVEPPPPVVEPPAPVEPPPPPPPPMPREGLGT